MPTPVSAHVPVLLSEVLSGLQLQPNDDVIDATLGGGGHARAMLERTSPKGRLLALEGDQRTLSLTQAALADLSHRITFVHTNYRQLKPNATAHHFTAIAGILFDLGLSSIALADPSRGFSFQSVGPLDMRLDPETQTLTAGTIVNEWPEDELIRIFRELGEERQAGRIAKAISLARRNQPLMSTSELAELVTTVKPRRGPRHPATQIFQALRMTVNDELGSLQAVLPEAIELLRPGGRLAVITFHSLEDRLVKVWSKSMAQAGQVRLVNKHVIVPERSEILQNPRARSAKLRLIEKI